jgi:predicted RNA-binding protein with PUA-like domain
LGTIRDLVPVAVATRRLAEIRAEAGDNGTIRQSRLSVAPVRDEEWAKVLEMSRKG